jgi:hypothetical protein
LGHPYTYSASVVYLELRPLLRLWGHQELDILLKIKEEEEKCVTKYKMQLS